MKKRLTLRTKSTSVVERSTPLCVFMHGAEIMLAFQTPVASNEIDLAVSTDGTSFTASNLTLKLPHRKKNSRLYNAQTYQDGSRLGIIYKHQFGYQHEVRVGSLEEGTQVISSQLIEFTNEHAAVTRTQSEKNPYIMIYGERALRVATSKDGQNWTTSAHPLLITPKPLEVLSVHTNQHGVICAYVEKQAQNDVIHHSLHILLLDPNTLNVLWHTTQPLWLHEEQWPGQSARHLGTVMWKERLHSYWLVNNQVIYSVVFSGFPFDPSTLRPGSNDLRLDKHEMNPILSPHPDHEWESFTAFNPAALYANDAVHILYRAQGYDYVSSVGYAKSVDGISIEFRSPKPVFAPHAMFETNPHKSANPEFISGGSYGGCEDPRVTLIDDMVYMTYVAFDGWSPPRLALTSLLLTDFLNQRWNWSAPVLISPPGIVDKSGCLLPEKINGKYVFFHRVFPNILIDFVDDLNFDGKTTWLKGEHTIGIRENMWDSRKIGAGAPPLKTKDGWLLIYYGVDDSDASKYKVGAMLLDLNDPTKVLHRTNSPILEPDQDYENNGFKPGIAYPCGAVIVNGVLMVYYGGSDSVVCVATAKLDDFLHDLTTKETATLSPLTIREVTY